MVTNKEEATQVKVMKAVDAVHEPIIVSPNTLPTMLASAGRVLAILITGAAVIIKLMSAHDLMGVWLWLQTSEGGAFMATAGIALSFTVSQWATWKKHKQLIVLAATAPDSIGQVK